MKKLLAAALALIPALALASIAHAADSIRYIALVNGGKDKAGHLNVSGAGSRFKVDYLFKDNGRGPELKEEYTLAADGTYASYKVKGTSTFGSLVDESFHAQRRPARAGSPPPTRASRTVAGTAIYSPLGGTPQAFLRRDHRVGEAPDGKLPMIPERHADLAQARRTWKSHAAARSGKVQLLALTGVGFTPTSVWATTGDSPRLFAFIYPGFLQLIEEGWEKNGAELETRQIAAEKELLVDFNKRLAHSLPGATLIRNARVFDSERADAR